MKTVTQGEDRSKELVLLGVSEEAGKCVTTVVNKVLEQIDEKPQVKQCRRIGKLNAGAAPPIIFSVRSPDIVYQILKKASYPVTES